MGIYFQDQIYANKQTTVPENHTEQNGILNSEARPMQNSGSEVLQLCTTLEKQMDQLTKAVQSRDVEQRDEEEGMDKEWLAIATVLDRICLIVFLILSAVLILTYLGFYIMNELSVDAGLGSHRNTDHVPIMDMLEE